MDLRVPTLIKFLNRLKSGTVAGNKIYPRRNRRNNFGILKKVVYLVYYFESYFKKRNFKHTTTNESKFLLLDYGRRYRKPFLASK